MPSVVSVTFVEFMFGNELVAVVDVAVKKGAVRLPVVVEKVREDEAARIVEVPKRIEYWIPP